MTRTSQTTPGTTVVTPATAAALRDMAYVLHLTGKIASEIRSGSADPRKPRRSALAAV